MHLLDTNIFIRAIQGRSPEAAFLQDRIKKGELVISVVVVAEFIAKANTLEQEAFDNLLTSFPTLEIDEKTARAAGLYRKEFGRKIKRGILLDYFLAAQAKLHHLTLVTNNRSDFPMKDIRVITP